jgi:hypothetical protein
LQPGQELAGSFVSWQGEAGVGHGTGPGAPAQPNHQQTIAMRTQTSVITAGIVALSLTAAQADPKSELKEATKKLADQSGYSWTWTPKTEGSESARRQGPVEGKTEKDGFTLLKGSFGENSYEAVFKGSKIAVNYTGDWVVVDEEDEETGRIARRLKALKNPVEEAEDLLNKAKELKKESEGLYVGDLTADGAKELFGRLGRRAAEAPEAKGSVKFWVKDGLLAKYECHVEGKITVGEDKREVEIKRTTTVEVKDAGSTKVPLSDEVKKKVS